MLHTFGKFFHKEGTELVEWAKCGEGYVTVAPTLLWAVGAAALAQRLITALFRLRFIFRRVPLWEQVLQNLLFVWMVIYSMHCWVVVVKLVKIFIEYCYEEELEKTAGPLIAAAAGAAESRQAVQQWCLLACGAAPLALYLRTRPRADPPPLMIWITTNPWQRREMGPYGYYLSRPPPPPPPGQPAPAAHAPHPAPCPLRRAFSDSNILIKEPPKRKRHSKSI